MMNQVSSDHKWINALINGKTISVCEQCNVKEKDVGSYLESPYCEKTPQAIEHREREEYRHLTNARDCGRQEGVRIFESRRSRWEQLDAKYGQK